MSINNAYDYAEAGFRIFPLYEHINGVCQCYDEECNNPGKHPSINAWNSAPYWSQDQLEAMVEYTLTTGFGVCLDDHIVLDIDKKNGGYESYNKLCNNLGIDFEKESGFVVNTGGGGLHIYFTVPNGSDLMAHHKEYPGIDFKSGANGKGSYLVGCGSLHASMQTYERKKGFPQDIGPAPNCILKLLHREKSQNKTYEGVEVSNQEISKILEHLSPDIEYHEWVKVGMAIHHATNGEGFHLWDEWSHVGEKYDGREQLDRHWHSFGKSNNPVTIGTLINMGYASGYVRPVTFDHDPSISMAPPDDDDIEYKEPADEVAPAPKPKHVKMLEALLADDDAEMLRVANMQWLIDGLIPAESFGVVFGEPGCGKSFTMVDMACSVSSGEQWQGLDTGDEGLVIYISAEGGNGMRFRKRAWEQKHKRAPLMRVLPMTTIMDDPKDVGQLAQVLQEYKRRIKQPIKMLVVDTLNRSMMGNENDNSDMADFVRGCEKIQHEHKCGVVVVHHSGKDAERGARGASSLKAATDFEIMVGKKEDIITVTHTRAKDVEPIPPVICRAEVVVINGYLDYKGRDITSLVPMAANFGDEMRAASLMSERETILLDIVKREAVAAGADDMSCEKATVRESFGDEIGISGGALAQAISKNLKLLRDRGMVEYDRSEVRYTAF